MEIFHIKKYIETRKRDLGLTNGSLARRIGRTEKTLRSLGAIYENFEGK